MTFSGSPEGRGWRRLAPAWLSRHAPPSGARGEGGADAGGREQPTSDLYGAFLSGEGRTRTVHRWHHYFPIYEQWFSRFRGTDCLFVEIGVQAGGSLQMWRHWLGPAARIVGIDIDPACAAFAEPGTRVFVGDQADPDFLRHVLAETGGADVVVDDGGHTANQMITTFEIFYPAMSPDGVYLIEDTHAALWPWHADRPDGRTFMDFVAERMIGLHDWTGRMENDAALAMPADARAPLPASEFCRTTRGIHVHDGITVFERAARGEPRHEIR